MNKKIYKIFLFLIVINFTIFSSQPILDYHKTVEPGYRTLIEDPLFVDAYATGKQKYHELYSLIQNNSTNSDEELISYQQDDLKYILYKKTGLIESLGYGYKIYIYPSGKIIEVND